MAHDLRSPLRASSRTTFALVVTSAAAMLLASAQVLPGCAHAPDSLLTADPAPSIAASSTTSGAGGGGGAANATNDGPQLFAAIQDQMVAACGVCHDVGGLADTPFLAGPDRYHSIVSWPGIVAQDPTQSILLQHPVAGGGHSGTNLDSPGLAKTLFPKVKAWLDEEAKGIAAPVVDAGKFIQPTAPIIGFNAVYLDALGDAFKGMAITFNAAELTAETLQITELEVHPTSTSGVHLSHPLFVVYPDGGLPDPDPVDSFSNVDQSFDAGQTGDLGPGTVLLTNWKKNAKLSIAFETIELITPASPDAGDDGGSVGGGCKDVDAFNQDAAPLLKSNCFTCHGGANAQANAAVDMSKLDSDPASACSQVKNRVSPADAKNSQLFVTTDPGGNAAHPYKFGGSSSKFNDFRTSVSMWITAEQ